LTVFGAKPIIHRMAELIFLLRQGTGPVGCRVAISVGGEWITS
jgi:hypothetical protein